MPAAAVVPLGRTDQERVAQSKETFSVDEGRPALIETIGIGNRERYLILL
jgi:hypothetical protein